MPDREDSKRKPASSAAPPDERTSTERESAETASADRTSGRASGESQRGIRAAARRFLDEIGDQACSVVVDLGSSFEVARPDKSRLKRLQDIAGRDAMPVFDPRPQRSATVASLSKTQGPPVPGFDTARFVEFSAESIAEAGDLVTEIRKGMADESLEALPVPTAVPALGPATFDAMPDTALPETPDFTNFQGYLSPGPAGLGFFEAWNWPGGTGAGVTIIDVEGGWRTSHVELAVARFSLWAGSNSEAAAWMEHGTAVVSLLAAAHDGHGTSSICPGARVGMVSVFEKRNGQQRIANSIAAAGDLLNAGDVILLELQRPGPRTSYASDPDQKGYVPLTFWPDVRAVVRDIVSRGIAVISVGGNGGENLDDEIFSGRFDRARNDSGCIMVGAGAPPNGTFGKARGRMDFSNYGSIIDVQAWGHGVVTAGYGDLWGGEAARDQRYTAHFMGTSSAAPLIAGVVACIQGRHKSVYGTPVNPLYLREVFRRIGWSPEADASNDKPSFVLQPDLAQLFAALDLV